jgi:hypothetical protein
MGTQQSQFLVQIIIICNNHAAFARGRICVGKETETADLSSCTRIFSIQSRSRRVGRIFDYLQVVSSSQLQDLRHITGITRIVVALWCSWSPLGHISHLCSSQRQTLFPE